jgi:hypothetical protein
VDAVRKANALRLPVIYAPWQFNDIAGADGLRHLLISP